MVVVVAPSSGGNVLANSSSVCQFLVTEVRRATMGWLWSVEIARPILSGWAFSGVGLPVGSAAPVARYLVR